MNWRGTIQECSAALFIRPGLKCVSESQRCVLADDVTEALFQGIGFLESLCRENKPSHLVFALLSKEAHENEIQS